MVVGVVAADKYFALIIWPKFMPMKIAAIARATWKMCFGCMDYTPKPFASDGIIVF